MRPSPDVNSVTQGQSNIFAPARFYCILITGNFGIGPTWQKRYGERRKWTRRVNAPFPAVHAAEGGKRGQRAAAGGAGEKGAGGAPGPAGPKYQLGPPATQDRGRS